MEHMDKLHPKFKGLAKAVLSHVAHLCELSGCSWYIARSWSSPERQQELYEKGRVNKGGIWVPKYISRKGIVTNAQSWETPHCVTIGENPASCAIDIALVQTLPSGARAWLSDDDLRWGILGTAAALAGHEQLTWGGMWTSLRDFSHLELKDWEKYAA